jgi:hypothetical protein
MRKASTTLRRNLKNVAENHRAAAKIAAVFRRRQRRALINHLINLMSYDDGYVPYVP